MSNSNQDVHSSTTGRTPAQCPPANSTPLFSLGQLVSTPAALKTLEEFSVHPLALVLGRHVLGDWGDLCVEDRELNQQSIASGMRIFSSYKLKRTSNNAVITEALWVITEADRSSTTILLPAEY